MTVIAASAAALLSLSACGPPKDGGTYESLDQLHGAYAAAELECPDWKVDEAPVLNATESGSCSNGVVLAIYPDKDKAMIASISSRDPGAKPWMPSDGPYSVRGLNWVVTGGDIEKLAETTGGNISYRAISLPPPAPAS